MKRILAATDFSTRSDRALRRAVLLAGHCDAALTLVHVVDDDQPAYVIDRERAIASELLQESAKTIGEVDLVATSALVATGDAFAGILQSADEVEADLIIIGPHRRQLLDIFLGTTAERTIRRSRRPVLMANAVPTGLYNRSLVAVDFDSGSRSALDAVCRFGLHERTDVIALHLFHAPATGMLKRAGEGPAAIDHYLEAEESRASSELASLLAEAGLRSAQQLLRPAPGSVSSAILACAEEQKADVVVIGTNQRKGIERFLLGSVSQAVLLEAKCDVLVVPATDELQEPGQR